MRNHRMLECYALLP